MSQHHSKPLHIAIIALLLLVSAARGEESITSHNAAGRQYIDVGRWDKAITEFRGAIALEPSDGEAHLGLCRAYLAKGRLDRAIDEGLRAVQSGRMPTGQAYLSMAYTAAGELGPAASYAQTAADLSPPSGIGHAALALVWMARKDLPKAIASMQEATDAGRRDPEIACIYARIELTSGNEAAALSRYHDAIRYRPTYSPAFVGIGRIHWKRGDLDAAAEAYATAVHLAPDSPEIRAEYAEVLVSQDKIAEARSEADRAAADGPDSPDAYRALGRVLRAQGDLGRAARALERAISLGRPSASVYEDLADCYRRLDREPDALRAEANAARIAGDTARVIERMEALSKLQPESLDIRLEVAQARLDAKQYDAARAIFQQVLDLSAGDSQAKKTQVGALVGLGNAAFGSGDNETAIESYKKALAIEPGNPTAWESLARVYDSQWIAVSRSIVRVATRLTSPGEPYVEDVPVAGGSVTLQGELTWVQRGIGSGFVVDEQGDIVTNAHVVESADRDGWAYELWVGVRRAPGSSDCDFHEAKVVAIDRDADLAIVRTLDKIAMPTPLHLSDDLTLAPRDWVFELGQPLGGGYGTTGGAVLGHRKDRIRYDADFKLGSSGGPLVNERGYVVGVVSMGSPTKEDGIQEQLAVGARTLRVFLRDHGIPFLEAPEPVDTSKEGK